jgi:aspartyl-tRNA(Asn)/glutamyl-tRNA(Gln) amidotransferase subunit A
VRILRGESMSAADYIDLLGARKSLIARTARASRPMTRWFCRPPPTRRRASPISPTTRRSPSKPASLRNCTLINMIDGCAISLPAHREGEVPVGLMLAAAGGADRRIFELAAGMEAVIRV